MKIISPLHPGRMLNRRALIAAAPALAMPMLTAARGSAPSVLVIGTGIAGIAAALDLRRAGCTVTMLEARNRIGGRIDTVDDLGFPVDLGASWIHGAANENPIWRLKQQYNLATVPTDYEDIAVFDRDGRLIPADAIAKADENFLATLRQAGKRANRQQRDTSLQTALDRVTAGRRFSAAGWREWQFLINWNIEQDYGAAPDDLSAWWWDQDSWLGGQQDEIVRDGYRGLLDRLIADGGLGEDALHPDPVTIKIGDAVQRIEQTRSGVRARTANGKIWTADVALVTVPLGVLRANRIAFDPVLPRAKRSAIQRLRMGTLNKLYLRFPVNFWQQTGTTQFGYMAERKGYWAYWYDYQGVCGAPVLVGFNAAVFGSAVENLGDAATVAQAMSVLRVIFGQSIPDPEAFLITRWNHNPWSLGSYSHIPPGASGASYEAMQAQSGKLFWAGEATNRRYPQTVAGAWLSGQSAAGDILVR